MTENLEKLTVLLKQVDPDVPLKFQVSSAKSMSPLFTERDVLVFKRMPFDNICIGDVIGFWQGEPGDHLIAHRVVDISVSGRLRTVQTKGDNNIVFDSQSCSEERYFGLVVAVERASSAIVDAPAVSNISNTTIAGISRWQGKVFAQTNAQMKLPGVCMLLRLVGKVLYCLRWLGKPLFFRNR